jgi:hypothetical protein
MTMMTALKMIAETTAERALCRPMMLRLASPG